MYKSRDMPLQFCWYQHFFTEYQQICYIKNYRYKLHFNTYFVIALAFFWVFKGFFNKPVAVLMMSAKLVTQGLLKTKLFWDKGYDVTIPVNDITDRILSRESNFIVDVVMWPKFGNSSTSMREFIITSIL